MKRMHVNLSVESIEQSTAFYTQLFGAEPTVRHGDYAKWMLDDPKVNFAISARGHATGVDHLGIQVESDGELADVTERLKSAGQFVLDQKDTACCYAKSDKGWVLDPQGIVWETFFTKGAHTSYGDDTLIRNVVPGGVPAKGGSASCCGPRVTAAAEA